MSTKGTFRFGFAALMMGVGFQANASTTANPVDLAKEQEALSKKIVAAYSQKQDISGVIERLEQRQLELKDNIHDPEISNLLDFLQLCLDNIRQISAEPHSIDRRELLADLSSSIGEGSRYIARALR